jgi:hypothetical protein
VHMRGSGGRCWVYNALCVVTSRGSVGVTGQWQQVVQDMRGLAGQSAGCSGSVQQRMSSSSMMTWRVC